MQKYKVSIAKSIRKTKKPIPKNLGYYFFYYIWEKINDFQVAKSNLYKGNLSTIIMKLLSGSDKMYGYEITQKVKAVTKGKLQITEGALYPTLHKLEAEGILEVEVTKVDNRLRKYYRLTEKGSRETVNRLSELDEYINTLQEIISLKPKFG